MKSQQQKMTLDGDFWSKEDIECVQQCLAQTSVDWTLWNEVFDTIIYVPTLTWEVETKREDPLISDMLSTQCDDIKYATDKEKGKVENEEEDSGSSDNEEKDRDEHEPSEEKLDDITEMDEHTVDVEDRKNSENNENIESTLYPKHIANVKTFQLFVNFVNDTLSHMFQLVKDDTITLATCKFVCTNVNEDKVANLVKLSKQEIGLSKQETKFKELLDKYKQFDTIVNLFKLVISRYFLMKGIPKDLTLCYIFSEKRIFVSFPKILRQCHDAFEVLNSLKQPMNTLDMLRDSKVFSKILNEVKQSCQGNLKVIMEQCAVHAKEK
ncbi:hypothetical protein RFI_06777 [Reticulomyxa filosa]|uniref:Uncharacterized protein n=1 Tax=Reticulomyxa filosa TaxID=46433 RepID=X6NWU1_RETFI|nr:hypothetical protein RFI_06777 [Reticulomyxa filosa]|eukprot:ETO30343.1 hypothetical protein RFI_06777 [Reticulomyxa filosa]